LVALTTTLILSLPLGASAQVDLCSDTPAQNCLVAGMTRVRLSNPRNPERRHLQVQLTATAASPRGLFGDPTTDTDYAVCLYDHVGQAPVLAFVAEIPASSDWLKPLRAPGWRYDDFLAEDHGFVYGRLRPSNQSGRAKIVLRAVGENLPEALPFSRQLMFALQDRVVAQVVNSEGSCWQGTVLGSEINRKRAFKATGY
jgi:hypothetical protein